MNRLECAERAREKGARRAYHTPKLSEKTIERIKKVRAAAQK